MHKFGRITEKVANTTLSTLRLPLPDDERATHSHSVCTVASRYYKEKPHIYGMAIHFAKAAAANAVIDGWKTVEMVQAFALWSVYNPPARRWEEDRAWCYTGIAFRSVHSCGRVIRVLTCLLQNCY